MSHHNYNYLVGSYYVLLTIVTCSEVALSQIEAEVGEAGLTVAGLYHAHDNMADNHVDVFNQKVVLPFLCQ